MTPTGAPDRIFHLALAREWADALAGGRYQTSTRGRTVEEEGFTHCCHPWQVAGVGARYYRDLDEPLVLLEVDPARLSGSVVEEVPAGGREAYPHVYGGLDVVAVVAAHDVGRADDGSLVLPEVVSSASGPSDPSS